MAYPVFRLLTLWLCDPNTSAPANKKEAAWPQKSHSITSTMLCWLKFHNWNSVEEYIYSTFQWTGCQIIWCHVLLYIERYVTYNILLVLGVQHNDSVFGYTGESSPQSITVHSYFFLLVMRTFKIYSFYKFHNRVLLIIVANAAHYIPITYLFYNWKLYLLTFSTIFAHKHPPPLATTNLFCSLYLWLFIFFFFSF